MQLSNVLILLFLALLTACSNLTISSKKLTGRDLSGIKSFAIEEGSFVNTDAAQYNVVILNDVLQTSIAGVLSEKKIKKVSSNLPDIYILYQFDIEAKSEHEETLRKISSDPYKADDGTIKDAGVLVPGIEVPRISNYSYGDLLVKVIDASDKTVLWQGSAGLTVAEIPDYSELEQKFEKVLYKLFRKFP